jgi:hypothetical protein
MTSRLFLRGALALAVTVGLAASAAAAPIVINLDARVNTLTADDNEPDGPPDVPVPVALFLAAGTYTVTPVGLDTPGALYTAWSNFGINSNTDTGTGCAADGTNCATGWLNVYFYQSAQLGFNGAGSPYGVPRGAPFQTAALALANAVPSTFTLSGVGDLLEFGFIDHPEFDNFGGMSLLIDEVTEAQPIPEPMTLTLLATGLVGIGVRARRRSARLQ